MGMAKVITVDELLKMCQAEKSKGNGSRRIYISQDDEGNSFHPLYFGFTTENIDQFDAWGIDTINPDTDILLG